MAHTDTQLGRLSNLTSQLDSNLVLSMTTKTAQPNPLTIKPPKKRENRWQEEKQSQLKSLLQE
jgi:hypothetical protein